VIVPLVAAMAWAGTAAGSVAARLLVRAGTAAADESAHHPSLPDIPSPVFSQPAG
jgi:hypothetical protein